MVERLQEIWDYRDMIGGLVKRELRGRYKGSIAGVLWNYINPLKEEGVTWGYDMQYLFTGLLNRPPKSAIDYTKAGRKDLTELYNEIILMD